MSISDRSSSYLKFLPAIYQKDARSASGFTGMLLLAFEKMLTGVKDEVTSESWGIEKILDDIHLYFDPETTPDSFVTWLAGWMALDLIKGSEWNDPEYPIHIKRLKSFIDEYYSAQGECDYALVDWITREIRDCKNWDGANQYTIDNILCEIDDFNVSGIMESAGSDWVIWWLGSLLDNMYVQASTDATAPVQHLPYRASSRNRKLIRALIPLFPVRGTRFGFEQILLLYLGHLDCSFIINELLYPFQIGGRSPIASQRAIDIWKAATKIDNTPCMQDVALRELKDLGNKSELTSVIGCSSVVGEGAPYYFRVTVDTKTPVRPTDLHRKKKMIAPIIDQEKPAHTFYSLKISAPSMQIGVHCTIGVDTLIGGLTI